jgi:hypothetical protein
LANVYDLGRGHLSAQQRFMSGRSSHSYSPQTSDPNRWRLTDFSKIKNFNILSSYAFPERSCNTVSRRVQSLSTDNWATESNKVCKTNAVRLLLDEKQSAQQRSARLTKTVGGILDSERRARLLLSAAL